MTTAAKERAVSIVMVAALMVSASLAIYGIATFGVSGMFAQLPHSESQSVFLISAIFLFIVAGTDYPVAIRKSPVLRILTMTWAIWQFLLYFLSFELKKISSAPRFLISQARSRC
jgi:hypothetical protein